MTSELQQIEQIVAPPINDLGYGLVRIALQGGDRPVLQIMVEREDRAEMTVRDCARISKMISAMLDVADPIEGEYQLEVSSPGIDRPLVRLEDFERFAGFEAKLELVEPWQGRKRFHGILGGISGNVAEGASVVLVQDGNDVLLEHAAIKTAKLVLTEALIKASQDRRL